MHAAKLKPLLTKGALIAHHLKQAAEVCEEWYTVEPSLVTFTLRSVFQDLIARGWKDPQGVPNSHYLPLEAGVLPHLIRIVDALSVMPSAEPIGDLDALVVAYRDSLAATP